MLAFFKPGKAFVPLFLALILFLVQPVSMISASDPAASGSPTLPTEGAALESKIGSSLSLRVKLKTQSVIKADAVPGNLVRDPLGENPSNETLTRADVEKVFIHFAARPTPGELKELSQLGVVPYPDSWMPPLGSHPSGFILADMPVGALDKLAAMKYVVKLETAEIALSPQNDVARSAIGVNTVWSGGDTGAGVTVAVLDSGIDATNPDFAALNSSNSKDYSNFPTLDDTITNNVTGHGTHVTGSLLGRGVNSTSYKGMAPGASLVFLKIGNDSDASASNAAMIYAIKAAADNYQARVINISYGGWSEYHDGSDEVCQAVDYATNRGASVFIAAGNDAASGWHYSGTVPANSTTADIPVTITAGNTSFLWMNLVWFDGLGVNNHLSLRYFNPAHTEIFPDTGTQSESSKGTEAKDSSFLQGAAVSAGTYYLRVQNLSGSSLFFHIYYMGGSSAVTFSSPDSNYTINSPSEADTAISVGSYVARNNWKDYTGLTRTSSQMLDSIATYSSRGPRVDTGAPGKPDIVAPGSSIISVRDRTIYTLPSFWVGADIYPYDKYIVDDDGVNQNGSGPADYFIMQGTSMASPIAAGAGTLLLSRFPWLTPAQVKAALKNTATDKGAAGFDNVFGSGLINAAAAVNSIPSASKLAFTTQPGGGIAGSVLSPQPVVAIQDAAGNVITNDNSTMVTLAISGDTSAALSGITTVTAINGLAIFSGLSLGLTGSYILAATSNPVLTAATSNIFAITPGPASQLVFTAQPGGGPVTTGVLNTQPVVAIEDALGNVVTNDNSTVVTLAISGNTSAILSGGRTVTAINGLAAFDGLSINRVGSYTLTATSNTLLPAAISNAFTITPGPASQMVFTTQPGSAAAGTALNPQPVVAIQDALGNLETGDNGTRVTLTIIGNTLATLSGNTTVKAVNGYAAFNGLSINRAGTYTFSTTSTPTLPVATSNSFVINPGPASTLMFTSQPGVAIVGAALNNPPQVAVEDNFGNVITSDNTTTVTLAISGNTSAALSGNTTVIAVNGLAVFNALSVNQTGAYTLTASSNPSYASPTSNLFSIISGNISGAAVNLSMVLQGGSRPVSGWVVPLTVKFFVPGTADEINGTSVYSPIYLTAGKNGSAATGQVVGINPGTYDITVGTTHVLCSVKKTVVIAAPSTDVNLGTLLEGDANGSGNINIQDFGILAASYGKSSGAGGFDPRADFDRNGVVNIADFGLLAANYSKHSLIPVP